jgi:hypothetical protein
MRNLTDDELELVAGGDIVVVGVRPDTPWLPEYNNPTQASDGPGSVPNYPYPGGALYNYLYDYTVGPYDSFKQEINVDLDRPATALETQAIDALKQVLQSAQDLFSSADFLQKTAVDANGNVITGSEVANFFKNVDILITDASYDNGGVGRAHTQDRVQGQDVLLEINITGLVHYMGNPSVNGDVLFPDMNEGLIWLAHELGHVTVAGQNMNAAFNTPGSNVTWTQNEAFAWSAGKAILEMAGKTVNYAPVQGYGSPFTISTQP